MKKQILPVVALLTSGIAQGTLGFTLLREEVMRT
jgi:hypothetical protein